MHEPHLLDDELVAVATPATAATPATPALAEGVATGPAPAVEPLPAGTRCGPLTVAQQQLWHLDRTLAEPAALNLFYALAVDGRLDLPALRAACNELGRRHEPLRTTYARGAAGEPEARVHPAGAAPAVAAGPAWILADLRLAGPAAAAEAEAARQAQREARRPFDLARGPLLRVAVLLLAPGRHVLLIHLHHICADGWSLDILARELSRLYAAARERRPCDLAPPPEPCTGHAAWQRQWLGGQEARRQLAWWREYLRGVPRQSFLLPGEPPPGARPRRGESGGGGVARQTRALAPQLAAGLQDVGRKRQASWFMVLLAALDIVLARWTGCPEVVVGTLVANRPTAAAGGMLGAHYNVALLRCSLAGDPCLGEVILRVVESTLPALDRQGLPFAAVAAILAAGLGIDPAAIPAAVLQVDRHPLHALRLQGATVGGLHLDEAGAGRLADLAAPRGVPAAASCAPLTFFVRETPGGVTLSLFYHPAAIGHPAAARLLDAYLTALGALTGPLDLPALELDLELDLNLAFDLPDRPSGPAAGGLGGATAEPGRGAEMTARGGAAPEGARLPGMATAGTPAAARFLPFTTGSPVAALSPIVACSPAVPIGPAADHSQVAGAAAAGRRAPAPPAAILPPASSGS